MTFPQRHQSRRTWLLRDAPTTLPEEYLLHFDPSIGTENLGDEIIAAAVTTALREMCPESRLLTAPTGQAPAWRMARLARHARLNIIGGANTVSPHRLLYSGWKISGLSMAMDVRYLLMGVGRFGTASMDPFSAAIYRRSLHRDLPHSCRDEATASLVATLGVRTMNTGCPTMWSLTPEHCAAIPRQRGESVVFTLTHYLAAPQFDRALLQQLRRFYDRLCFWPQQLGDLSYLRWLAGGQLPGDVRVLTPTVDAFSTRLRVAGTDYVGTRLHAGVLALSLGRRALVVAVDNRAPDIARDTGLPVVSRESLRDHPTIVGEEKDVVLTLPWDAIARWKAEVANWMSQSNRIPVFSQ